MPALHLQRSNKERAFYHIYNHGILKQNLFLDKEDYATFLNYIEASLSPPVSSKTKKVAFIVRGKEYKGVPRQTKNLYKKVELIAYKLQPSYFHLLLRQNQKDSQTQFLRSLFTRYSIYLNKKYKRSGTIFHGPYKSLQIKDPTSLFF